jgi:hypothetical protein
VSKKHHLGPWERDILIATGLATALVVFKAALDARTLAKLPWFLSGHISTAAAGALLIFALLVLVRVYPGRHQSHVKRKLYSLFRKLLVAVVFAIAYWILAMLWDIGIVGLYGSIQHYHIGFLFPPLFIGLIAWLIMSLRWIWRLKLINYLLILVIHKYLQYDPRGIRYGNFRRRLYTQRHFEWTGRRYELALLKLIESSAAYLEGELQDLEIRHLNQENYDHSTAALAQTLQTLAIYRSSLSEHYFPSYRRAHESEGTHSAGTSDMRRLAAVEQIEAVWVLAKRLAHLVPDKHVNVNSTLMEATQSLQALYRHLKTLPDTAFSSSLPLAITHYRLSALDGTNLSSLSQNLCSLQVEYIDIHDTLSIRLWDIAVESWLVEAETCGDEQVIIQGSRWIIHASLARQAKLQYSLNQVSSDGGGTFSATRRRALEASLSQESDLQRKVYRYAAHAWWRHARTLGSNEFGEYAWQRGLENLRMAEDRLGLSKLKPPLQQIQESRDL